MAKKIYGSVGGFSDNVAKIYSSVNGLSKNIVKGYCSVGGLSKLFFGGAKKNGYWCFYTYNNGQIIEYRSIGAYLPPLTSNIVTKTNTGIAFYCTTRDSTGSCVITLSTDSNAVPYVDTIQGYSFNPTTGNITINDEVWYYAYRDLRPNTTAMDVSPLCEIREASFSNMTPVEIITWIVKNKIRANYFTQNYKVNSSYDLNITSKEDTIKRVAGIFLYKTVEYKSYSAYSALATGLENIILDAFTETLMYNKIAVGCSLDISNKRVELDIACTNTAPTGVNITYRYDNYENNGYDLCGTGKSYTCPKYIRYWYNNNDSSLHKQVLTSGYSFSSNLGITTQKYTTNYFTIGSNLGVNYYNYLMTKSSASSYIQFASLTQYYNALPYVTTSGYFHYASKTSLTNSPSLCRDGSIVLYIYKSGTYAIYFEALSKSPFYCISGRTSQGGTPTGSTDSKAITYNGITYYRGQLTWQQQSNASYDEEWLKVVDEPSTQYISDHDRFLWEVAYIYFNNGTTERV